jgi:hypothetical protein
MPKMSIMEGIKVEIFGALYDRLVFQWPFWYILWLFGNLVAILVNSFPFWFVVPRKFSNAVYKYVLGALVLSACYSTIRKTGVVLPNRENKIHRKLVDNIGHHIRLLRISNLSSWPTRTWGLAVTAWWSALVTKIRLLTGPMPRCLGSPALTLLSGSVCFTGFGRALARLSLSAWRKTWLSNFRGKFPASISGLVESPWRAPVCCCVPCGVVFAVVSCVSGRVTRLGEFSPFGWLFTLDSFFGKLYKQAKFLAYFFHGKGHV